MDSLISEDKWRFRCPACQARADRWALIRQHVDSDYKSDWFPCRSCGARLVPIRPIWAQAVLVLFPILLMVGAIQTGNGYLMFASLLAWLPWVWLWAWLWPYVGSLRLADQGAR